MSNWYIKLTSRNPLDHPPFRQWFGDSKIVGRDGNIYHYGYFDAPRQTLTLLSIFHPDPNAWRLLSHTYANTAEFTNGQWTGRRGWCGFGATLGKRA